MLELSHPDPTHATVLMDNTKAELKVLTRNLRRYEESDPYSKHSLSEFLHSGKNNLGPRSLQEIYNPGDLVLFNSHEGVGFVLSVLPDVLKVLNASNQVEMVKIQHVSRKINFETRGISGRQMKRAVVVADKYHNQVTLRTIVKPVDT